MRHTALTLTATHLKPEGKEEISIQLRVLRQQGASWNTISKLTPVSMTTTRRWVTTPMDTNTQSTREVHARRPKTLSPIELQLLFEEAKDERKQFKIVNIAWAKERIKHITNYRVCAPTATFISRIFNRFGWKSWKTTPRNSKEIRPTLQNEARIFREYVCRYILEMQIPKSRVWTMDETGLWNGSVLPRTYVDPETRDSSVEFIGDHRRDTGVVALSWEGLVFPWFIHHVPQRTGTQNGVKVVIQKAISGLNIELMRLWVQEFQNHIGPGPAVLILDQLSIHKNRIIMNHMTDADIKVFLMPGQTGKLLSPCDNFFFASLKREMNKHDCSNSMLKEAAFNEICIDFSPEKVINCWNHCGWEYPN
jgi:transposase